MPSFLNPLETIVGGCVFKRGDVVELVKPVPTCLYMKGMKGIVIDVDVHLGKEIIAFQASNKWYTSEQFRLIEESLENK